MNGSERILIGTLREDYLPKQEDKYETSNTVTWVWDVENKGYRSFRNDSVISYEILKGETYA